MQKNSTVKTSSKIHFTVVRNTIYGFLRKNTKISVCNGFACLYNKVIFDAKMIRDFIRCIIENTNPPIDVEMGIKISLPGIIANESAKQGGTLLKVPGLEELITPPVV